MSQVADGKALDASQLATLIAGTDGTSTYFLSVDANGQLTVLQGGGTHTCTVNSNAVTVNTSTTAIVAAAAAGIRERQIIIYNNGDKTVYIGVGASATTSMFGIPVGATLRLGTLLAVNGICSGSAGQVAALVEARS